MGEGWGGLMLPPTEPEGGEPSQSRALQCPYTPATPPLSQTQWLLDFTAAQLTRVETRLADDIKGLKVELMKRADATDAAFAKRADAMDAAFAKRADATDAAMADLKKDVKKDVKDVKKDVEDVKGRLVRVEILIGAATAFSAFVQYFLSNSEGAQKWLGKLPGGGG